MRRRPVIFAASVIAAMVIVGAAGYVTGGLLASRDTDALITADQPVFALAEVEERTIVDTTSITGTGVAADAFDVIVPAPEGSTRAVVTSAEVQVGDVAESGTLLGSVSGRPIFTLQMQVLGFRDLGRGTQGPDVDALHAALEALGYGPLTAAQYNWTTEQALRSFYVDRGFTSPGGAQPRFMLSEFVTFSGDAPKVTAVQPVNAVLDADTPFARMAVAAPVVVARATVLEADRFAVGDPVTVRGSELNVTGSVTHIGEFDEGDSGTVPGLDITIEVDGDVVADQPYSLTVEGEQSTGLAVPTAAVRQQGDRLYVVVDNGGERIERPVTVESEADGWSRVTGADLQVGQQIVIQ